MKKVVRYYLRDDGWKESGSPLFACVLVFESLLLRQCLLHTYVFVFVFVSFDSLLLTR